MNTKAYSYARWSSRRQADGQSLERQLSAAKAYADFHKLDLDPSMVDDGVSAYRGKNRLKGELASFKAKIMAAEIPVGSFFLIDSYDRFSREEPTISVQSLLEIINAGVNVVTLSNNMVFSRSLAGSGNGGGLDFRGSFKVGFLLKNQRRNRRVWGAKSRSSSRP